MAEVRLRQILGLGYQLWQLLHLVSWDTSSGALSSNERCLITLRPPCCEEPQANFVKMCKGERREEAQQPCSFPGICVLLAKSQTVNRNEPSLLDSWPSESWNIIITINFKPPDLGTVCYAAKGNQNTDYIIVDNFAQCQYVIITHTLCNSLYFLVF